MKKLLTIALLTLSPVAFTKDFNPDLLVGTWQCETKFSYPDIHTSGIEKRTETYKKNGFYYTSSELDGVTDGQKTLIKTSFKGQWKLENNILSSNKEEISHYSESNQKLKDYYQFETVLKEDKSFQETEVLELTKNKLVMDLSQLDKEELKPTEYQDICYRVGNSNPKPKKFMLK